MTKHGMPEEGYYRPITRRESEITGFTRATLVENTEGEGVTFWKFDEQVTKGSKKAAKTLNRFWNN